MKEHFKGCTLDKGRFSHLLIATTIVAVLLPAIAVAGVTTTVALSAAANAAIFEDTSANPPANGAGTNLFLGRTGQNLLRRSFLRFDIAGEIPPEAIIDAVELDVFVSMIPPAGEGFQTRLFRVTTGWSEGSADSGTPGGQGAPPSAGDATWLHTNFNSEFWTTEGGDFVANESATELMTTVGPYTFSSSARGTVTMEEDVQAWLDDPATNFGWVLRGVEAFGVSSARRVDSRHSTNSPPVLRVTFTAPEGASVLEVPAMSKVGLATLLVLLGGAGWFTLRSR